MVKSANNRDLSDPFDRIGVDPYWEFKVFCSLMSYLLIVELGAAVEIRNLYGTDSACPKNGLQR